MTSIAKTAPRSCLRIRWTNLLQAIFNPYHLFVFQPKQSACLNWENKTILYQKEFGKLKDNVYYTYNKSEAFSNVDLFHCFRLLDIYDAQPNYFSLGVWALFDGKYGRTSRLLCMMLLRMIRQDGSLLFFAFSSRPVNVVDVQRACLHPSHDYDHAFRAAIRIDRWPAPSSSTDSCTVDSSICGFFFRSSQNGTLTIKSFFIPIIPGLCNKTNFTKHIHYNLIYSSAETSFID